jgi:PiT family inorganic phosphate transporter
MAFNNGANDFANAFASAVGSKALKLKHALFIAATLNLVGAILLGGNVSSALIDGVIHI